MTPEEQEIVTTQFNDDRKPLHEFTSDQRHWLCTGIDRNPGQATPGYIEAEDARFGIDRQAATRGPDPF